MSDFTPRTALPLLVAGQENKEITLNEALTRIDALLGARVLSRNRTAPPSAPAPGDAWIVPAGATGAWQGREGSMAIFGDGGWRFAEVTPGITAWIEDEAAMAVKTAAGWLRIATGPGAAIIDPAGGSTVDSEARSALSALLAACRAAGILQI
jgi:hypothetical protein